MKYLYAIRTTVPDELVVKFGLANNPVARLAELQTGNSSPLVIAALLRVRSEFEACVHAVCREEHLRGEWFRYQGICLAIVDMMQQSMKDDHCHYLCEILVANAEGRTGTELTTWAYANRPQKMANNT